MPRDSTVAQRVKAFQDKIMFEGMLTFMICGAAILSGTHYPKVEELRGLSLLGDAHVQYHACETTSSIEVATNSDTIQLAPGVANIIRCVDGHVQIETAVVAKLSPSSYVDFAGRSQLHLMKVMMKNMHTWRIFQYSIPRPFTDKSFDIVCWACRTDGICMWASFEELWRFCSEFPEQISETEYEEKCTV